MDVEGRTAVVHETADAIFLRFAFVMVMFVVVMMMPMLVVMIMRFVLVVMLVFFMLMVMVMSFVSMGFGLFFLGYRTFYLVNPGCRSG